MIDALLTYEPGLRLGSFVGLLLLLSLVQWRWPRRSVGNGGRVVVNLTLVAVNTLVLRLAFPILAVGAALWADSRGIGLLHGLAWPAAVEIAIAVIVLDMIIYWQHRLMHAIPLLWRLHRMHHSDLAFDVSTGVRFHPVEIVFSMGIKMGAVVLLGAHPAAVVLFEILLSATSLFEHTNVRLPLGLDRVLRLVIVTPDMHRVHHSVHRDETDSNFGFNLSIWDRLFGSYRAQPRDGHEAMHIGLHEFRQKEEQTLRGLLLQPLR